MKLYMLILTYILVLIYINFCSCKLPLLPIILGGSYLVNDNNNYDMYNIDIDNRKRIFIPDKEKLVIDGHNMIHDMNSNKKLTEDLFNNTILEINKILLEAFPTQDIHFVIKNNSRVEKYDIFLEKIVEFSKKIPNITLHLAYKKETKNKKNHYMKARDDYLTIYLAKGAYMISKDRYRDFKYFKNIELFTHYAIKNGIIILTEYINPEIGYRKLEKPNLGNHLIYKIIDKSVLNKMKITNGSIYLDDDSKFAKIYLSR